MNCRRDTTFIRNALLIFSFETRPEPYGPDIGLAIASTAWGTPSCDRSAGKHLRTGDTWRLLQPMSRSEHHGPGGSEND